MSFTEASVLAEAKNTCTCCCTSGLCSCTKNRWFAPKPLHFQPKRWQHNVVLALHVLGTSALLSLPWSWHSGTEEVLEGVLFLFARCCLAVSRALPAPPVHLLQPCQPICCSSWGGWCWPLWLDWHLALAAPLFDSAQSLGFLHRLAWIFFFLMPWL